MHDISKILVVIDPTVEKQPAMLRAAWLARAMDAELELLVCYYNEYLSGDPLFYSPSLEMARQDVIGHQSRHLEELAEPLRESGVLVRTSVTWDHPLHDGVVRQAMRSGADMVIKDTHHHSALARALLTNTDWNLIRTCPVPLWLVKPNVFAEAPAFVAAIDPMHEHDKPAALDDEILQISKMLAGKVAGTVHAFHSFDPRIAVATTTANAYIPVSLPLDENEVQMHENHQKRFAEITTFHGLEDDKTHLVEGITHEELPRTAEQLDAAVVVMGAVTRNRWKRLFIGATAERTMEYLPCDLLIIKPDWFRTPVQMENHVAA